MDTYEARKHNRMIQNLYKESNIRFPITNVVFSRYGDESISHKEAYEEALQFIEELPERVGNIKTGGRGLYIVGDFGVGKTTLALLTLMEIIHQYERRFRVYFSEATRFFGSYFDEMTFEQRGENARAMELFDLRKAVSENKHVLVMDNLGAEREATFIGRELNNILRHRYGQGLPTIITTNIDRYSLDSRYEMEGLSSFVTGAFDEIRIEP